MDQVKFAEGSQIFCRLSSTNFTWYILAQEPGGKLRRFGRAISYLYHVVGTCLGPQENAVFRPEVSCGCIFCRPE